MNACIIGYGKSGAAARRILEKRGITDIVVYDDKMEGARPLSAYIGGYDVTVVSPGIDRTKYPAIPKKVMSEIELAFEEMKKGAKIIAVTGTNGKSTVTHLTAQLVRAAGLSAVACGNIGLPFADAVLDTPSDVYVVELSSFQVELLNHFSCDALVVTNITPDHLDRYPDMGTYVDAKLRLVEFLKKGGFCVADSDERTQKAVAMRDAQFVQLDNSVSSVRKGDILDFGRFSVNLNEYPLFGSHNVMNLCFSLLLTDAVKELSGDVTSMVKNVSGMPHRTELVGTFDGIVWINDSKATNVDAALVALASCKHPTTLILGGKDKKSDYTEMVSEINRAVDRVFLIGAARSIIREQLEGKLSCPLIDIEHLKDVVDYIADHKLADGETVLFSPACASFDQYKSFEHRGDMFAEHVRTRYGVC